MQQEANKELTNLLEFVNQCPFGLIRTDARGNIQLLNAVGSQVLIPIALDAGFALDNILDLIEHFDPELRQKIEFYQDNFGYICSNYRIKTDFKHIEKTQYLSFSIIRLNEDIIQYALKDVTEVVAAERKLNEITEATAVQSGKLEMASGILHDIGNAVTAFGTDVAKLSGNLDWRELNDLHKLASLFEKNAIQLDQALGAGKGKALLNFLHALKNSFENRQTAYQEVAAKLTETTSHIQDILNIQRHYVKGETKGERASIQLRNIIDDALTMQERSLSKRRISIIKDIPLDLPAIKGDKTKLIQVLVNVFKNTGEAFDEILEDHDKKIWISLGMSASAADMLTLSIRDNAIGFEVGKGESFFEKGQTSKETGTGFGLHNCRTIIETHQGKINLKSEGPGKGAVLTIQLPCEKLLA